MMRQIIANYKINIKYLKRNKLILISLIFFIFIFTINIISSYKSISKAQSLRIITYNFDFINTIGLILIIIIGITILSSHIKNRSIKMIFTKPCTIESYLISIFLTGFTLSIFISIINIIYFVVFSIIFNIPIQTGVYFIGLEFFFRNLWVFSLIVFLSIIFHPVLIVVIIFILNEFMLYNLITSTEMYVRTAETAISKIIAPLLNNIITLFFYITPTLQPYSIERHQIFYSFYINGFGEIKYFIFSYGYFIILTMLFYFLSVYFLKRKIMI